MGARVSGAVGMGERGLSGGRNWELNPPPSRRVSSELWEGAWGNIPHAASVLYSLHGWHTARQQRRGSAPALLGSRHGAPPPTDEKQPPHPPAARGCGREGSLVRVLRRRAGRAVRWLCPLAERKS